MKELDAVIEAAEAHGKASEPGHEVGDLVLVLYAAWSLMTADQQRALMASPEVKEVLTWNEEAR